MLQENNSNINVTLWRELAEEERQIGEHIQMSHCLYIYIQ